MNRRLGRSCTSTHGRPPLDPDPRGMSICRPGRAGSICAPSAMAVPAGSSGGRWPTTCAPNWSPTALTMAVAYRGGRPPELIIHSDRGSAGRIQLVVATPRSWRCVMGRPAGWMTALTGRSPMKSPGAPSHRREVRARVLAADREGLAHARRPRSRSACRRPVGSRWFRHAGGMPPFDPAGPVGPVPVVRRAGGDRAAEGAGRRRAGDRPASWARSRRRSRGSCAATPRPAAASWSTGRRWRSGRPSGAPAPEDGEAGRATSGCASTCRSGCRGRSAAPTGRRWRGRRRRRGRAGTSRTAGPALGDGVEPGADRAPAEGRLPR